MSKFTKRITKTYQFDGDEVTVTMNRLKRKDAARIMPFLPEADENGKRTMTMEQSIAFMDKAGDILSKYVTDITGLTYDDGSPVERELVLGTDDDSAESYFMTLLGEMMGDLMEASFLKSETEKKSVKLSNDDLEDTGDTRPA